MHPADNVGCVIFTDKDAKSLLANSRDFSAYSHSGASVTTPVADCATQ